MDTIKIENYKRENFGGQFPIHKAISDVDAEKIKRTLITQLNMSPNLPSLQLVKTLVEKSSVISGVNAESERFNLKSTILETGITPKERVFVNWYRFDQIDEISLDDLSRYFDYIWYPAVDDIDIFDDSLSWIISIGYSGELRILRFIN